MRLRNPTGGRSRPSLDGQVFKLIPLSQGPVEPQPSSPAPTPTHRHTGVGFEQRLLRPAAKPCGGGCHLFFRLAQGANCSLLIHLELSGAPALSQSSHHQALVPETHTGPSSPAGNTRVQVPTSQGTPVNVRLSGRLDRRLFSL